MKQLNFHESNLKIHKSSKLSRPKRISASKDLLTDITNTEYSKRELRKMQVKKSGSNY